MTRDGFLVRTWNEHRNRGWVRVAGGVLAAVLVVELMVAARSLDPGNLPGGVSFPWLFLALFLVLVPWLTNALRILIWGRFLGGTLRASDAATITLVSEVGAAFTPTVAGSGGVRFVMLLDHGFRASRAAALLALMALEDGLFFAVLLPLGILHATGREEALAKEAASGVAERAGLVLAAAAALGLLVSLLVRLTRRGRSPRLRTFRERVVSWWADAGRAFVLVLRRGKLRAACTLALTAVQWMCRYTVVVFVLAAFGQRTEPLVQVVLQWVVFAAGTFIPTPGGATGVEAVFAVLYAPLVPETILGPVVAVWRLVIFYVPLALAAGILSVGVLSPSLRTKLRVTPFLTLCRSSKQIWTNASSPLSATKTPNSGTK